MKTIWNQRSVNFWPRRLDPPLELGSAPIFGMGTLDFFCNWWDLLRKVFFFRGDLFWGVFFQGRFFLGRFFPGEIFSGEVFFQGRFLPGRFFPGRFFLLTIRKIFEARFARRSCSCFFFYLLTVTALPAILLYLKTGLLLFLNAWIKAHKAQFSAQIKHILPKNKAHFSPKIVESA